jgi:hypothetical protein
MSIRDFYDTDTCKGCGRKAPDGTTWSSGFCPECSSPHKEVMMEKNKEKYWWAIKEPDGSIDPYTIRSTKWEAENELSCLIGETLIRVAVREIKEKP